MKYYFSLAVALLCIAPEAVKLIKVTGTIRLIIERENGKEFWGYNYTVLEGEEIRIPCNSKPLNGSKPEAFFWQILKRKFGKTSYDTQNLISQFTRRKPFRIRAIGINHSLVPKTHTLKISSITRYATGTYICTVVTEGKKYLEMTYFNVEVKAPARIDSTMKTAILLSAGDKLELDCTSSGNPTPVVNWIRTDGRSLEHSIRHLGLLSVQDVGQKDRGEYRCIASNYLGNDSRTFKVNVTVSARIITKEPSYGSIGQDGMVKCEAVGFPVPSFIWKWQEGLNSNTPVTLYEDSKRRGRHSVKTIHKFGSSISYLMIRKVRQSDFRDYQCIAKRTDSSVLSISFKQNSVPDSPEIINVAPKFNGIKLSWYMKKNGGKPITSIIIEYALENSSDWTSVTTHNIKVQQYEIKDLQWQTSYKFRIYAENDVGRSRPSGEVTGTTRLPDPAVKIPKTEGPGNGGDNVKQAHQTPQTMNMKVMVAGVAGGFLVLIIAIVIVCILMRNMQRNSAKKAAENAERLAQNANQDTATALITFLQHGGERLSGTPGSGGTGTNSGDVLQLTTSNKWEFPRERLVLQNILGSGAFGIVMKAEADGINGFNSGTIPVAVKFVKENESASAKKDLVAELELLKLIEPHTNVINLLGCCTRSEPLMVIVEYCAYGDLQSFLRSSRGIRDPYYIDCYKRPSSRLTSKELLMFGTQISRGMAHLACLKVIHRDLAARNILVDENKVCKVSDFGFARDIYVEDHYTRKTAGGRFPIKWMAIESLLDGISTTKSDVWSFAIVLWEIITLGASPYPGMNSQEVVSFLQNGMRMDKPKHCSDELYNLLLDCWQVAAHRRPNFEMLARYLDKLYNDDFEYIDMRTYDDHLYINFDGNTISGGSNSATLMKQDSTSSQHSQQSGDSVHQ